MNQATESVTTDPARDTEGFGRSQVCAWSRWVPAACAVLATLWVYRSVLLRGQLPGNIGDARWTIALHEHWYRVWTGAESVRDLHYYYPLPNTLGTSEAFLVQGQFYALARVLGLDQINSWVIAGFAFFLIGALGVAALACRLLDSRWAQAAMVLASVASYPVLVAFGHIQLYGMLAVSWILVGLHDLVGRRHVRRGIALLVLVPPLLALSSWYAMVLAAVLLAALGLTLALVSSGTGIARVIRQIAGDLWCTLRSVLGAALAVLSVLLWAAVLWVFLPGNALLPEPNWGDVEILGPRWSDIWNASGGGGGIWSWLYARVPNLAQSNFEQQRGFTPILFVAFAVLAAILLRSAVLDRRSSRKRTSAALPTSFASVAVGRSGLLAACLAVGLVLGLFLIDERGLSLYRFFWFHVPGLESVRAPFRVMAILYGVAVFVVLRFIELALRRAHRPGRAWRRPAVALAAGCLLVAIFVEMQRPADTSWTRADLLPPALLAQVDHVRGSCDAVIVLGGAPDDPPWKAPIDAVVFATMSNVPTPQGYSRADPIGYPGPVGVGDGSALVQWMRNQGFQGRVCGVSAQGIRDLPG